MTDFIFVYRDNSSEVDKIPRKDLSHWVGWV